MKACLIALVGAVLGTIGCGSGGTTTGTMTMPTVLLSNNEEGGVMGCWTEGPYKIPDGASMTYDIVDANDNMKVGIANFLDGCDLTNGLAVTNNTNWAGEVTKSTGSLPGGSYDLVFICYDVSYFCSPTVYSLSYQ
jgi:hypothetical protein